MTDKSRLTLDLEPELHRQLKIEAARERTSMREICIQAIKHHLTQKSRADVLTAKVLTAEEAPLLAELWDNEDDAVYDDL